MSCAEDEASSVGSASSSCRESAVRREMYEDASGDVSDEEESVSFDDDAKSSGRDGGSAS